jgi:hypothetical protein
VLRTLYGRGHRYRIQTTGLIDSILAHRVWVETERPRRTGVHVQVYVDSGDTSSSEGSRMPPDLITGRDTELIAVGILSLFAGGAWAMRPDGSIDPVPLGTFLLLASVSVFLAWVDIHSRGGLSIPRDE